MGMLRWIVAVSCQRWGVIGLCMAMVFASMFGVETVQPESKYHHLFFMVAWTKNDKVDFGSLSSLQTANISPTMPVQAPSFPADGPKEPFSFLLPDTQGCVVVTCYHVTRQDISGQWIEIIGYPDSMFARKTWSLYHATENTITPIALRKQPNHNLISIAVIASLFLYVMTGVICFIHRQLKKGQG